MIIAAEEALPALKAQAEAGDGLFDSGSIDLLSRNQMRLALLSHRATLANLNGNLDELCVALEIASGRPLQPEEGLR
jgi:outer membrane protein TolC